mmetsp:Transcript_13404/g.26021  ORF Transcript_13404/g.26021 Transcript_13404/m.26021 type:complete len:204 (+) Transcript_13404:100-711(+)
MSSTSTSTSALFCSCLLSASWPTAMQTSSLLALPCWSATRLEPLSSPSSALTEFSSSSWSSSSSMSSTPWPAIWTAQQQHRQHNKLSMAMMGTKGVIEVLAASSSSSATSSPKHTYKKEWMHISSKALKKRLALGDSADPSSSPAASAASCASCRVLSAAASTSTSQKTAIPPYRGQNTTAQDTDTSPETLNRTRREKASCTA